MIQNRRIQADIEAISRCTATPGSGASRPTFSQAWRDARDYVQQQLEVIGCKIRIDAAGNLRARPNAISWDVPAWVSGSHIDTVPHGGDFDGVVGIVTPLEAMRAARENIKIAVPLELVIWAEEEGPTFGLGMLGSRAVTGNLTVEQLANLRNADGQNFWEAGRSHGADPTRLPAEQLRPGTCVGLIEVHVEQGPALWTDGVKVGLVTTIAGRRQYRCELRGVANHAGSTSMRDRFDALAGCAEIMGALEKAALEIGHGAVITVGQITAKPNAINVIPETVHFSIDFRSASLPDLANGDALIHKTVERIATARRLGQVLESTEAQPAVELDERLCAKMRKAAERLNISPIADATSGALHDAAILAPLVPTAMLFVPSRDGISHNSGEFSRIEDIGSAAAILLETVRDRRLG